MSEDYKCPHGAPYLAACKDPVCIEEMNKVEAEAYCPHGFLVGCPVCDEPPKTNKRD